MSTFEPEWPGLPSEDEISEYLATAGCDDPYDPFPTSRRPRRPSWRGGPRLSHAEERDYLDEQDDQ
ncbi:hypothetical protein MF672_039065 [Actinomadura sp. ATCC 31491]|uniref:Uncharacterized protein n=1 Tax=Actinomadura luzonensis TaxID=2805427 RepID=A0ABT0G577_9ACTN|nr:hypothetical protein [Actinomadura luzonensis]MCK2219756.1 hypothetical protein [Actinomadura luzonensis]